MVRVPKTHKRLPHLLRRLGLRINSPPPLLLPWWQVATTSSSTPVGFQFHFRGQRSIPRVDIREVFNPYADEGLEDMHGDGICEGALHDKLGGWTDEGTREFHAKARCCSDEETICTTLC